LVDSKSNQVQNDVRILVTTVGATGGRPLSNNTKNDCFFNNNSYIYKRERLRASATRPYGSGLAIPGNWGLPAGWIK